MIYLDVGDLIHVAERALGQPAIVRDHGLLEAAAARPRASAFGADAYPDLETNGRRLTWSNDEAYDFIVKIADGRLDDISIVASLIRAGSATR